MDGLKFTLLRLTKLLNVLSILGGAGMAAVIVISSIARYVVGAPLAYQEELVGLLFVALVFPGTPYSTWTDGNICITIVTDMLPGYWRKLADLAGLISIVVFASMFCWLSYQFTAVSYEIGSRSDMGYLLLYPWMALMPVGMLMMGVAALTKIILHLLTWTDSREPVHSAEG